MISRRDFHRMVQRFRRVVKMISTADGEIVDQMRMDTVAEIDNAGNAGVILYIDQYVIRLKIAVDDLRAQLRLDDPGPPVFAKDYIDPVPAHLESRLFNNSKYAGHWLAGFAPVGNTHLVVVVQTRYEDAVALDRMLIGRLAGWAGVALATGALTLVVIVWFARTRSRRLAVA